jgi:PST family polysaccharide transporter
MQVAITGLFYASRGAMEGAVLPGSVGFTAIGLMGRALALYRLTFGRIATAVNETIYPLLPQSSADLPMYHRRVGIFLQAVFVLTIPGAVFIGIEGPAISRIVYGMKWVAADPLFLPAALVGAGLAVFTAATNIILGRSKMRDVVILSAVFGIATVPALLIPVLQGSLTGYLWALAGTQAVCCGVAFVMGKSSLPAGWFQQFLTPVVAGTAVGCIAVILVTRAFPGVPAGIRVAITTPLYGLVVVTVIQTIHPTFVTATLRTIPSLARYARYFERLSLRRIPV